MNFVKKWASCVVSFLAGVLALVLSACSGMVAVTKTPLGKEESLTKAFKVITDSKLLEEAKLYGEETKFMMMKVFSIILLAVAILLLIYSIVMLLKNLNVIKSNSRIFGIIGMVLVVTFLISSICVLVSSNVYASAVESVIPNLIALKSMGMIPATAVDATVTVGIYQPIMLVVAIITSILVTLFEVKNVK